MGALTLCAEGNVAGTRPLLDTRAEARTTVQHPLNKPASQPVSQASQVRPTAHSPQCMQCT